MQYKKPELYTSYNRDQFEVIEHYLKDQDPWVRYRNTQTGQEYTCRQEAFLQRFCLLAA